MSKVSALLLIVTCVLCGYADETETRDTTQLQCSSNEIQDDCPIDCPTDHCPKSVDSDRTTCTKADSCPPAQCKCRFNFRRSDNGTCIETRNCPPFDCSTRPNEVYTACKPLCSSDNCSMAQFNGECPPQLFRVGIVVPCMPACRCDTANGFFRMHAVCVPVEKC